MRFLHARRNGPLAILGWILSALHGIGAEEPVLPPAVDRPVDFDAEVRPLFEQRCLKCHGPEKQKGGWRVDVKDVALHGGEGSAPNIVPGKSAESPLIRYVAGLEKDMVMPQRGDRLTPEEIGMLRAWIDRGASWPGDSGASPTKQARSPTDWWSLRPLRRPAPPADNATHPIDAFIGERLAEAGLSPSPEADRRSLIRRLSFDLIGLPPSPEDIDSFVADPDPAAYERLVDRLLASPRHGERWARHWLDVVHYGDTQGYDKDKPRENAWPYRDYIIHAFNQDKPYARFVQEQIAGDVLYPGTQDGLEALGFIAAGPWDFIGHAEVAESKIDGKIARHLDRDDMVANTIGTFNSMTVHCAQCHNHKFDPIKQEDYYSLQAVFSALDRADKAFFPDPEMTARYNRTDARRTELTGLKNAIEQAAEKAAGEEIKPINARIGEIAQQGDTATPAAKAEATELKTKRAQLIDAATTPADRVKNDAVIADLATVTKELAAFPKPRIVFAGTVHYGTGNFSGTGPTGGKPRPVHVLGRGQVTSPGAEVAPGALAVLTFAPARFAIDPAAPEGDRRAALAQWLTHPDNPLTWRSIVNRVWQFHFGRGLVATPSDFGRNGARPSHPELLDWLAAEFRDSGGSLKSLHRLIVLSKTYRQSSASNSAAVKLDGENLLYWRQDRRKLDAEAVRDSVLQVSGMLDLTMGGPGWKDFVVTHPQHSPHYEYDRADPDDPACRRRAVYRFIVRSQTQPFMTSLDCADPSIRIDQRNEGLSPLQALTLLNNGFMLTQARHFSERLETTATDPARRIEQAYRFALGRFPTLVERDGALGFVKAHGLANYCRVLLNLNEFMFID